MAFTRRWFIGGAASFGALAGCRPVRALSGPSGAPELTFGVVSDVHLRLSAEGSGLDAGHDTTTLVHALEWFRDNGVDAVMIPGDLADKGLVEELQAVAEAWNKVFPGSKSPDGRKVERIFVCGNHDWDGFRFDDAFGKRLFRDENEAAKHLLRTDLKRHWEQVFDEPYAPMFRRDVNGYSFLAAHWQNDRCRGADERAFDHVGEWLARNGGMIDPSRPFFYCQHAHPRDTVYGSWAWGHDRGVSTKALSSFPNAVAFSGHSHYSLTDERSIWQGRFTSIGAGTLHWTGMPFGEHPECGQENTNGTSDDFRKATPNYSGRDGRQGMLVRVYGDRMVLSRRDFMYGRPLGDDWTVPLLCAEPPPFAFAARAAKSSAPEFPPGAKVETSKTLAKTRGGKVRGKAVPPEEKDAWTFSFPQALATSLARAFYYELTLNPSNGETIKRYLVAEGFNMPVADPRTSKPMKCTITGDRLPPPPFNVEVRAVTSLGRKSRPILGVVGETSGVV